MLAMRPVLNPLTPKFKVEGCVLGGPWKDKMFASATTSLERSRPGNFEYGGPGDGRGGTRRGRKRCTRVFDLLAKFRP